MISKTEAERLAAMAHGLRPDWPVSSLMTFLAKHTDRAYRDVAVALAWVATDPHTKTPARLNESGPWWNATTAGDGSTPLSKYRIACPDHPQHKAGACPECEAQAVPRPEWLVVPKRDKHQHPWVPQTEKETSA